MKPTKLKKVENLFYSFCFLFSGVLSSQNYIDIAKIEYALTPQNSFGSNSNKATVLYETNADITYPIVINKRYAIITGINFENIKASFNPYRNQESITGLTLKLGVNIKHNSKWSGTYMVLPRLSSDFENISSRDFQIGGAILLKYTKSEYFNYKFGVFGNKELYGASIVPMFGFYFLNTLEKFEAKILLPISVDLNYKLSKHFKLGISFKGLSNTYNISQPIAKEKRRYLEKSVKDVYTYLQYKMNNGINFQFSVGRSIDRSYRVYNEKISFALPLLRFGDNRTQLNTDFSDSWLFKMGCFYRFNLK